jgi:adenosylhomocysteine nucleosidase
MNETIAILGAVTEEIAGIKREINISDRVRLDKSEAWFGKYQGRNIVLVRTGVGRKRAQNATQQVIDKFNPEVIISMGYAGALTEGLNVGDMFVASTILSPESDSNSFEMDDPKNLKWLELAKKTPPPENVKLKIGRLITVDMVVHTPKAKKELGSRFRAEAVEMETLEIALLARVNKIAFISIRGISDAVNHELIDCSSFLGSDGELSKLRAGWYVLTHPKSLKNAFSLRSNTQIATQNLTDFISRLISI